MILRMTKSRNQSRRWLVIYLAMALLLLQWSGSHVHLAQAHDHGESHHHHSIEAHSHDINSHFDATADIDASYSHHNTIELAYELNLQKSDKLKKQILLSENQETKVYEAGLPTYQFISVINPVPTEHCRYSIYLRAPPAQA